MTLTVNLSWWEGFKQRERKATAGEPYILHFLILAGFFVCAYTACCSLNGNKTKQKSFQRLFLTEECSPLCIYTPLLLLLLTQTNLQKSMML